MPTAVYSLQVDWGGDDTFGHAEADITADALEVSCGRGRDRASQLVGRSIAGLLTARLKNDTGKYSSFNSASPLYGLILPGRKVRLRATAPVAATLWTGYLARVVPLPSLGGAHRALLEAEGPLALLARTRARVAQQTSIATGTAAGLVLDAIGWPAADRDVDAGQTTMTRWWADETALNALRELEETEAGFLREDALGRVVFEGRHRRLTAARSVTSQQTYSDAGADIGYGEVTQEDPFREVFKRFTAEARPFAVGAEAVLWTASGVPSIEPGDTLTVWAQYPNPDAPTDAVGVDAWTTPVAGTDYVANAAADGTGADLTAQVSVSASKFATSMKLVFTNNAAVKAYLTTLQARGTPVTQAPATLVSHEVADAPVDAEYPSRARWLPSANAAQDLVRYLGAVYGDKRGIPVLAISYLANRDSASLQDALEREVSDRVTVLSDAATELGIGEDFFVEALRHTIRDGGMEHVVTLEVSPVRGYAPFWRLGTGALGTTTALAY